MASIEKETTAAGAERWAVHYRVNGRLTEQWFTSKKAAETYKKRVELDSIDGRLIDPRGGSRTLDAYFAEWLASRLVRGRSLTAATRIGYERLYTRNIAGHLGASKLNSLRPDRIRTWHAAITIAASADQAAKSYRLLRAVLATAEADQLIPTNPCRIRGAGEEHAQERPMVPTALVLDLADAIDPRYRALVLLAGIAGLRTGENLGLRRRDVDLLHGEVHVEQQAQEVAGTGRVELAPKSEAGRRTVTIPSLVADALHHHLNTYTGPALDDPVFTGPGPVWPLTDEPTFLPLRRATLSKAWRAATRATGAPEGLRPHDLRHHAATLAARTPGVTTKELMARIGHASPRAALIYQHATAERDRAISSYLEDVLASSERPRLAPVVGNIG